MNQAIHRLRLLFCFFSGEDDYIIRKCNADIQISFALIGFFVQLVFILCWISAALFISHVFDGARWMSIPIGILWALLVTNLYLLLLYTITPALLPVAEKKRYLGKHRTVPEESKNATNPFLSFSFLTRVGFIIFLAIIMAQPFNVCFFATDYEAADKFATTIQEVLHTNPLSRVVTLAFCCLMLLPVYFKYRVRRISRKNFHNDFEVSETKGIQHLREQLSYTTDHHHLARQVLSIDISSIRTSDFYFQKTLIEYRIILEEYEHFKKEYSRILTDQTTAYNLKCADNLKDYCSKVKPINPEKWKLLDNQIKAELKYEITEKYEYWADPPFRTISKSANRNLAKETDLLQILYPDN